MTSFIEVPQLGFGGIEQPSLYVNVADIIAAHLRRTVRGELMTSFIEIPRLGFGGAEQLSLYVNVADIISFNSTYDNGTEFNIRDLGAVGMSITRCTYLPISMFLDVLGELARFPGVRSWSDDTKDAYRIPAQERARVAADREREAAHRS